VIPVPKADPLLLINLDLHPISLTATLNKLLESFVGSWILDGTQDKLEFCQYGALKGRSTTHGLVDMLHQWHKAVDESQSMQTVFIDFAKAFDHVDHNILITKLRVRSARCHHLMDVFILASSSASVSQVTSCLTSWWWMLVCHRDRT